MSNYFYYQGPVKTEDWKPVPAAQRDEVLQKSQAVFCTALSVSKLVDGLDPADKDKLAYEGAWYLDWDSEDIGLAIAKVQQVLVKFREMGLNADAIRWYATGLKGFHAELPMKMFLEKPAKNGIVGLPHIYKEMVYELAVDTLDLKIYSSGKGRMWRLPNVRRPDNGFYKVPLQAVEVEAMTPALYAEIIKQPRTVEVLAPEFNVDLHLMFANAAQKVEERFKNKAKRKRDPQAKIKAQMPSVRLMMAGEGLKATAGFHELAMQVTIAAVAAGLKPEEMIAQCSGIINNHVSDSQRYNSPEKRERELLRLYDYMLDNPGYDFSVGAIKVLLSHEAPDLDGLHVNEAEIKEGIAEADQRTASGAEEAPDEYSDVAGGVTMSRYGIYIDTDSGKKRICAVSFKEIHLLYSMSTGQLSAYEAEVMVNGRSLGRQTLELDTFSTLQAFNGFCRRLGHAMQGLEQHVRGLMMRFVEEGKKKGKMLYIAQREGLDLVNIPSHEEEGAREPFMVYAALSGVLLDPRVRELGLEISFQGFPDPRGLFKTDLADAPSLAQWVQNGANKEALSETLKGLFEMQRPEVVGKLIGWYTACFWRMLFHKAYSKFPLLHVNGAAGSGKTEMNLLMSSLFYYNQEPKMMSPGSTLFSIQQHIAASASVPLIIDEYKPNDMNADYYNKLRLTLRDAYNCREVTKGGGNRDSDDYRMLHSTHLAAPIVFIAEAAEEESAVAERVVLITITKPSSSVSLRNLASFNVAKRSHQHFAILGQYIATSIIEDMNIERLCAEFDPIYEEARRRYMLTAEDLAAGLDSEARAEKQGTKERSIYNFSVARFGLRKFRELVETIYGKEKFRETFDLLDKNVFARMQDLQSVTQPEWAKVLVQLSDMSWNVDADAPYAIRPNREYALDAVGGDDIVEVSLRTAYLRYRAYAGQTRSKVLFPGDSAFLHAMKDCTALIDSVGTGRQLKQPGVARFNVRKLAEAGVPAFKPPGVGPR